MITPAALIVAAECRVKLYLTGGMFDRTLAFYRHRLSLPVNHEWNSSLTDRGVMFATGPGMVLELIDDGREYPRVVGCGLSLAVSSVWSLHRTLTQRDLDPGPLRDRAWGDTECRLADPSGFVLTFYSSTALRQTDSETTD